MQEELKILYSSNHQIFTKFIITKHIGKKMVDRVDVVGKNKDIVINKLHEFGLKLDEKNPEAVISFGGDGTSLYGERIHPEVPRVVIRHKSICNLCESHDFSQVLPHLKNDDFEIVEEAKLEAWLESRPSHKKVALNEIDVHHNLTSAIRLELSVNDKIIKELVIADSILVATPHGSTGYFQSITRKTFKKGFGIAFNNSTAGYKPLFIRDTSIVKIKVLRGPGYLLADNDEDFVKLREGDTVIIKRHDNNAHIIQIKGKSEVRLK